MRSLRVAAMLLLGVRVVWAGQGPPPEATPFVEPTPNPKIKETRTFHVPTELKLGQFNGKPTYGLAPKPLDTLKLKVGQGLYTGAEYRVYLYPEGAPRPDHEDSGGTCDVEALADWTGYCSGKTYGPVAGVKYVLEVEILVFQTEVPPKSQWEPYGEWYKVLWTGSVKGTVQ